ncbi:efflux RND transporter periplasmic adaptor subunit [Arachidicoccus sp.]|uniref:efflux RND transporter periplasmic adaptor subunit n=1 Tax=Arachidicoccus sp. TaxID=1872624 RepID=UPI003D1A2651
MKNSNYMGFGILACITLATILTGCHSSHQDKSAPASAYILPDSLLGAIQIDTVTNELYSSAITLNGRIDFDEDHIIRIYPMVSGIANNIHTALGDYVQRGELLATINSSDMSGYSNDLVTASNNLIVAKRNRDAVNSMYRSGLSSAQDSLNATVQYNQAKANVDKAKRVLENNGGGTNGDYYLRSPISGFIVQKNITNGTLIRPDNSNTLFTLSNLNQVWVMADVYESNIPYVKLGDSVNITTLSYPGKIFRGKIDKIMNMLDPESRVMKVRIVLNNPGFLLKPEMFASVVVNYSENKSMLSIPTKSLIFDNSQYYVLIYKSPSDISICPVQINGTKDDRTYITSGVALGDKVIATQALLIYQALND